MNDLLNVFIKLDAVKSMTEDGPWIFEGIASTDDMDLYDEVVYPDSFTNSIDFFKSNGKIFFDHDYSKKPEDWLEKYGFSKDEILSLKTPIGKPLDAKITKEGLYIKGILNKEHPIAQRMWKEFLNNPDKEFHDQIGLSIGAKYLGAPRKEYNVTKGKYITYLPDLLLYEVSMTPEPVNPFTKTWASVLKSIMREDVETQEHIIEPESVLFDADNSILVIKSIVQGDDGTNHVFESYINLKEDIRDMQSEDKKVILKAFPGQEEEKEDASAVEEVPGQEAPAEKEAAPAPSAPAAPAAPEVPGIEAGLGEAPVAPDGAAPEGLGGEIPPAEDAGSLLDSLVAGDEGGADPLAGGVAEDASTDMILDKQDTMLDLLGQILDALHGSAMEQSAPAAPQVTEQAPSAELLKSILNDNIKELVQNALPDNSVVSLSDESTKAFGEAIKSILVDFEDRVVEKLAKKLRNETTVVKSTAPTTVVNPGLAVSAVGQVDTIKSVIIDEDEKSLDMVTLKSFVDKYTSIVGYNAQHIQNRGKVIQEASSVLGINENEFRNFVRKAERNQL